MDSWSTMSRTRKRRTTTRTECLYVTGCIIIREEPAHEHVAAMGPRGPATATTEDVKSKFMKHTIHKEFPGELEKVQFGTMSRGQGPMAVLEWRSNSSLYGGEGLWYVF